MSGRGLALVSHSTKPRGGLVHTLSLAEELHRQGVPVHLLTLGDPEVGLFRHTDVPNTVLQQPRNPGETLDEKVFASIDMLEAGLAELAGEYDIMHAQDCIAARAAARVRDAGAPITVVRTVHHVDDFTTPALINCSKQAIVEPDRILVVSEQWRRIMSDDYGRDADIVPNGVDLGRFAKPEDGKIEELRARIGAGEGRFVFLAVGGVEPRKGTVYAFRALAQLKREGIDATLAVVGGHSFQDYTPYRDAAIAELAELGLELGRDVHLLGTVSEADLAGWYHAADALSFPSVKEGWGLVVFEAMAAGLPVIASDLDVFHEYLEDGVSALLPPVEDADGLAQAMRTMVRDTALRDRLRAGGDAILPQFSWEASARKHREIYDEIRRGTA